MGPMRSHPRVSQNRSFRNRGRISNQGNIQQRPILSEFQEPQRRAPTDRCTLASHNTEEWDGLQTPEYPKDRKEEEKPIQAKPVRLVTIRIVEETQNLPYTFLAKKPRKKYRQAAKALLRPILSLPRTVSTDLRYHTRMLGRAPRRRKLSSESLSGS
ncbi:unnamed protein product [Arabidopsis thaliana]|uniref:(thale cress) hypothetical protein n=1 Tax=Arabidopsis thaliana TaxID=3702 RepID=A0A7G2E5V2_ARATH|nr:unnamed protein product [Arabidopsis thaliana]